MRSIHEGGNAITTAIALKIEKLNLCGILGKLRVRKHCKIECITVLYCTVQYMTGLIGKAQNYTVQDITWHDRLEPSIPQTKKV